MASQEIAVRASAPLEPRNLDDLERLGRILCASGYFRDTRDLAQASVKVLAGREMGFPPIASMTGISIIEGKPATGANLLGAAMKRAGYTWKVLQRDAAGCRLEVSFRGEVLGTSEFMESDAQRAELLSKRNWKMYPRSMYFARAISDAARTYAPEVFSGIPAYTAEELGAEHTTEDGALVVEATAEERPPDGGSREAQAEVLEKRLTEERVKANGGQQDAPAVPPPPPAASPVAFPRTIQAPEVHPGTIPVEVERLWHRVRGVKSALEVCGELKAAIVDLTGADRPYYEILGKVGLKHANEIKGLDAARRVARELYEYTVKVRAALEPPAEHYQATEEDVPREIGGAA
jgi:hypothetical protein